MRWLIGLPSPAPRKEEVRKENTAKVKLKTLFQDLSAFIEAPSPAYGESHVTIRYRPIDLLWRPVGILVRFVLVIHPQHGFKIFMTTDLSLSPLDILRIYGFRFKIEVAFKQALYTLGTYAYHFWMASMTPRPNKPGDHYLHRKSQTYRDHVCRKMRAYHCHMATGARGVPSGRRRPALSVSASRRAATGAS